MLHVTFFKHVWVLGALDEEKVMNKLNQIEMDQVFENDF
jgi:hypothetical protein